MTMKVDGYATKSAKDKLGPHSFERRDQRPSDVVIEILYCGFATRTSTRPATTGEAASIRWSPATRSSARW